MRGTIICTMISMFLNVSACNQAKTEQNVSASIQSQKEDIMKNLISIVEIPTSDLSRAIRFYETILEISIEEAEMGETRMGVLPADGETVNVVLVNGSDYKPNSEGTVLYFNAGDDLQPILEKIEQNGGQIIFPKTEISPEMGFFALFIDTEGNRLGLHSIH